MFSRPWHARRVRRLAGLIPGLLASTAALLASTAALANPDKLISRDREPRRDADAQQPAHHLHRQARGEPVQGGGASGWVYVKANTITIDLGGSIVADDGGYPGVADMSGMCLPMSNGCGGVGVMAGLPGGGGGYFAAGADGTDESTATMCQSYPTSPGGMAFFDMATKALALGSAGGAAHPLSTTPGTAGGNGGGGIQLQAAVVVLNGTLSAAGATPNTAGGVGPGGGSGGSIGSLRRAQRRGDALGEGRRRPRGRRHRRGRARQQRRRRQRRGHPLAPARGRLQGHPHLHGRRRADRRRLQLVRERRQRDGD